MCGCAPVWLLLRVQVYMPEGLGLWGGRARLHVQGSPGRMLFGRMLYRHSRTF